MLFLLLQYNLFLPIPYVADIQTLIEFAIELHIMCIVPTRVPFLLLQRVHQLGGPGRVPNLLQGEEVLLCQPGQLQGSEEGQLFR